jgi:hypothetical protein
VVSDYPFGIFKLFSEQFEDTKGITEAKRQTVVFKTLHSEQFEDTKGIIRSHKPNSGLQNTTFVDHCLACDF